MFVYNFYRCLPLPAKNMVVSIATRLLRPRLRHHFSTFISPGDLVFDIGAHVGAYTAIFSDLGAQVVAVEPQPYCVRVLKSKFKNSPNVVIVNKGLSDQTGTLPLSIAKNSRTNSTFSPAWLRHPRLRDRTWDKKISVPVTTLEALIAQFGEPNFCKIDVEGHELKVMHGLDRRLPLISFEFDQFFFNNLLRCVNYLETLGQVRYNYALYGGSSFDSERWLTADRLVPQLKSKANGHLRGDVYARLI